MFAFRALFWFGVMCAVVPFKHFDLASGEITVDHAALRTRIAALPSYCEDHREVCQQARAVLSEAAQTGLDAARRFVAEQAKS